MYSIGLINLVLYRFVKNLELIFTITKLGSIASISTVAVTGIIGSIQGFTRGKLMACMTNVIKSAWVYNTGKPCYEIKIEYICFVNWLKYVKKMYYQISINSSMWKEQWYHELWYVLNVAYNHLMLLWLRMFTFSANGNIITERQKSYVSLLNINKLLRSNVRLILKWTRTTAKFLIISMQLWSLKAKRPGIWDKKYPAMHPDYFLW